MRFLNRKTGKEAESEANNRWILIPNLSWKQISILIFVASIALRFIYQLMQESQANESSQPLQLPSNCSDFKITSGNLNTASVMLLGEYHDFHDLTLQCLTALTSYLPLFQQGFNTYLEGNTNAEIAQNFRYIPECRNATQCLSWDHEQAFSETIETSVFVSTMLYILRVQKQLDYDEDSMREYMMTWQFENLFVNQIYDKKFINDYYNALSQINRELVAENDKTLVEIASINFSRIQKTFGFSLDILNVTVQEVGYAILREFSPNGAVFDSLVAKRDAELLTHVFSVPRPSFFIAGLAHVRNIKDAIANNNSVAVLSLFGP